MLYGKKKVDKKGGNFVLHQTFLLKDYFRSTCPPGEKVFLSINLKAK